MFILRAKSFRFCNAQIAFLLVCFFPLISIQGCGGSKNGVEEKQSIVDNSESKAPFNKNSDGQATSQSSASQPLLRTCDEKIALAERLLIDNELDGAWKLAKEIILERPNDRPSLFLAARILATKKDYKSAIQTLSVIDINEPMAGPAAVGQISEWLTKIGDLREAEQRLKSLLKIYPSAGPALRLLVDVYCAEGRRWESAKYVDRLIRMGDISTTDLMRSIDFREPFDNEPMRKAALEFAPLDPLSLLGDIRVFTNRNRWDDVLPSLESMVQNSPELLEPWIWYGESLLETGRADELAKWMSKRPEGYATHPEYWYIYGAWSAQQRKHEQAARCFVEALQLDRRHVASMLGLAESLVELDMKEHATTVRAASGKLVRINDMAQQIQRGYGGKQEFVDIANMYRELDDLVGAFGWDAILLSIDKKPMPAELVERQKQLKTGVKLPLPFLKDLPIDRWSLPVDGDFVSIASSMDSTTTWGESPIRMNDVSKELGLNASYNNGAEPNRGWFILEAMGGGVTVIDYDRDGWCDFYFSDAGDMPTKDRPKYLPKKLFRSIRAKSFEEVAAVSRSVDFGYGQGVGTADLDQDGFADLLVANLGEISCYRNQGDGTFERMSLPQAPVPSYWNSGIQAADINGDGLPDIIQCVYIDGDDAFTRWCKNTNSPRGNCHPKRFVPGKSRILYNQGDGTWKLADQELLDSLVDGYAFVSLISNIDQEHGNDVYIANDVSPNHLLLSRPDAANPNRLVECAASAGVAVDTLGRAQASMGIAFGDQNRDGALDIIVTNYRNEVTTLYLQMSAGLFKDGTKNSNLGTLTLDWLKFGCQLIDLDNDGWLDFTALNGHIDDLTLEGVPWKMPPQVMHNDQGKFRWLKKPSPGAYWDVDNVGRSLQFVDFNRDGRCDFVATHLDRPAALLCNQTEMGSNSYIQLELIGTRSERDAVGAIIRLRSGKEKWVSAVAVGDGFYGTSEHLVHLGLGAIPKLDSMEVEWPSGERQSLSNVDLNKRYFVIEGLGIEESK